MNALVKPALLLGTIVIVISAAATPAAAGFRDDVVRSLADLEEKVVGLAEAIPADQYGWRPAEGVRSVSEAFMHIAGGNFFFPTLRGMTAPAGVDMQALEKITDKAKVVSTLKTSFAHAKQAAEAVPTAELGSTMTMFGQEITLSGYLMFMTAHCHEHLGQAVAYARSIGVAPPWSGGQ